MKIKIVTTSLGSDRVLRGASWYNDAWDLRAAGIRAAWIAYRAMETPNILDNIAGFRLILALQ